MQERPLPQRQVAHPIDRWRRPLPGGRADRLETFWGYKFNSKEKRLALGSFPETSIKEARSARKLQRQGIDPARRRVLDKLSRRVEETNTFEGIARGYHATKVGGWSEQYGKRWLERLEKDVFPRLGSLAPSAVTAPLLLHTLRRVEARGVRELAHSLREASGQVFRYGIATGRCERNPASDLRRTLKPVATKHMHVDDRRAEDETQQGGQDQRPAAPGSAGPAGHRLPARPASVDRGRALRLPISAYQPAPDERKHRARRSAPHQFSITLPNEMADTLRAKVAAGEYATESEVIRDGLRALLARDKAVENWLRRDVAAAHGALKADPGRALSVETVKARLAAKHHKVTEA